MTVSSAGSVSPDASSATTGSSSSGYDRCLVFEKTDRHRPVLACGRLGKQAEHIGAERLGADIDVVELVLLCEHAGELRLGYPPASGNDRTEPHAGLLLLEQDLDQLSGRE